MKYGHFEKIDHDGIRTHNLLIRSQTPYPLGHAAMAFWDYNVWFKLVVYHPPVGEITSDVRTPGDITGGGDITFFKFDVISFDV